VGWCSRPCERSDERTDLGTRLAFWKRLHLSNPSSSTSLSLGDNYGVRECAYASANMERKQVIPRNGALPPFAPGHPPFTGKHGLLPEKRVNRPGTVPYPTSSEQNWPAEEDSMPGKQAPRPSIRNISGMALVGVGSAVLILYAGVFVWRLAGTLLLSTSVDAGLGMASLRAVQALAFDQGLFFAIALQILVLFSALAMTLMGIALLHQRTTGLTTPGMPSLSALPKGDQ
jgi:hypothetical protein